MAAAFAFAATLSSRRCPPAPTGSPRRRPRSKAAMHKPQFVAPGEAFDIRKLRASTSGSSPRLWPCRSSPRSPTASRRPRRWPASRRRSSTAKATSREWNRGMAQAVAQHADGIVTVGASPELMKGPTADALKANIPVVDAVTADKTAALVPGHVLPCQHLLLSFRATSGRLRNRQVRRQGACPDPRRQRVSGRSLTRRRHAEGIFDALSRLRGHCAGHPSRQSRRETRPAHADAAAAQPGHHFRAADL